MFDFLKNLTKSDEDKQQEAFSAYLDDSLSPSQRREFEARMAEDADLRAEMELAQLLRQQMREMPRRAVPRIFTLDAAVYGAPRKEPLVQAYPILRAATVLTAFFFVFALGLSVFMTQGGGNTASVAQSAMESAPAFDAPMAEAEIAMEEAAEEPLASEKIVEEAIPLPTLTFALTAPAEEEFAEESAMEADNLAGAAAPIEEAEGELLPDMPADAVGGVAPMPTPTLQPTATISSLPRPESTQTAVPRGIEPTIIVPDEIADTDDGETAVSEIIPDHNMASPSRSLTTFQIVLLGLGILLLLLVVVTLLARRRI